MPPATAQQCINYCTAFIERFGTEPKQGPVFLQECLYGTVRIIRVDICAVASDTVTPAPPGPVR